MVKKSVRGVLVALFVLLNFALVATPADAGRTTQVCNTQDGEEGLCCKFCWIFCDECEGMDEDPDNNNEGLN